MTETSREKQLRWSREAKRKRTGTCRVCGAVTRYSGRGGRGVSELCPKHAQEAAGLARRGKEGLTADVLAYLAEPHRFMEVRDHFGMTSSYAGVLIHRLLGYGLIRRVSRGVYERVDV